MAYSFTNPRTDAVFRALADPSRRAIFERLAGGEAAVKELTAEFRISQPAVSQHLGTLKRAQLVCARHEGRATYYRIDPKGLRPLVNWIAHYKAFWTDKVDKLQKLLEEIE